MIQMQQWWRKAVLGGLVIVGMVSMSPVNVEAACKCSPKKPSIEAASEKADAVFVGRVRKAVSSYFDYGVGAYVIEVEKSWKSEVGPVVAVAATEGDGGCDFMFWAGRRYLVYMDWPDQKLYRADVCGRTNLLSQVEEGELDELADMFGEPKTYEHTEEEEDSDVVDIEM